MALSEFPRLGFDPFVELRRMQSEMNRLFSGFSATAARDFPPINIWLGENSVVVTAELPGVTRDDVNHQPARGRADAGGQARAKVASRQRQLAAPRARLRHVSRARSSCRSGSIPIRSRRVSTTASWKSSCNGWKRIGRRRSKSALHDPSGRSAIMAQEVRTVEQQTPATTEKPASACRRRPVFRPAGRHL